MSLTRPRLAILALAGLVVLRSAVFVFWPQSHFDSDQAITGLMAKHLSEFRAFPVFWYGQTYMLGVESWLAAPLFWILGATVTALKLPLLAMNVAIALLLFRGFLCDTGLDHVRAAFATLFFVLAAPITAAHFLTANGGNVEPALYVLLLWMFRRRPIWMGAVLGVGFLNREFTIYGAIALVALEALHRTLFTRDAVRRYAIAFATAAAVWMVFLALRQYSSAAGPGTSVADLSTNLAGNNLLEVARRLCVDPRAMVMGAGRLFSVHWPELFGLERQPLTDFGIESALWQGLRGSVWLLLPAFGIPVARLGTAAFARGASPVAPRAPDLDFCGYLVLVAVLSAIGYLAGRCGEIDFYTMRYELLSVLGAAGLAAWYLRVERSRAVLGVWSCCCAAIFIISLSAHARLLAQYTTHAPVAPKQELIRALDARGIRYGYADFWVAYYVTFMSKERIIVASEDLVKVRTHNRLVDAHRDEAVRISRRPCQDGQQLTAAFWACRP
jgi:hypothetical protein